jgi:hypothetical protein
MTDRPILFSGEMVRALSWDANPWVVALGPSASSSRTSTTKGMQRE